MQNIFHYIAVEDLKAAKSFIRKLDHKMHWIAKTSFTGSPRDWVSEGLRGFPYLNRCIYFRMIGDEVHILRILHSRQDVTQQEFNDNIDGRPA